MAIEIEVSASEILGGGGFVELRRCEVRNLRDDGSRSAGYPVDAIHRPSGADAVVVLARDPRDPVRVLLRRGLRPAVRLGRLGEPLRDGGAPPVAQVEAVAGVLERGDDGDDGLRARAAAELHEEAGLVVSPGAIERLGPPLFISPGVLAEQLFFCLVDADLDRLEPPPGDGSPMEEGSEALVLTLVEALARCERGAIADLKTELALRRLAGC